MNSEHFLSSCRFELRKMKRCADRALDQVAPEDLFRKLDPESNSMAELMKHVGGNLRSRWTDFFTTDGEKAGRSRDSEFFSSDEDSPERLRQNWEDGWNCLFETLESLQPGDLDRTVRIRGETHSVIEAIHRSMTHTANHIGQMIHLAKHFVGPQWQTLTVPRGQSEQYTATMLRNKAGGYLAGA